MHVASFASHAMRAQHHAVPAGATVWLTGLPSAGKTTVAHAVAARLDRPTQVLDGDEVRARLGGDLGFSRADREENVARIGYVASLLAGAGVLTLVAVIAPYEQGRQRVRAEHERLGLPYLEVYVAAPVEVCGERDVKGLYARQRAGLLQGLTGVDGVYERPTAAELVLDTSQMSIEESADVVVDLLLKSGL